MIKLDLITGFLGAGKTTFIKYYAKYLLNKGERLCIIENDFGAINVDMVLMKELLSENCNIEMVVGGDGAEAHRRRLKTKLISMSMLGYTRAIVAPSGIFDMDELFDLLYEEPLDSWYEMGNVIAILDPKAAQNQSEYSDYVLMSEVSQAGTIMISKSADNSTKDIAEALDHINVTLEKYGCNKKITADKVMSKPWETLDNEDYNRIVKCGFNRMDFIKIPVLSENQYQTLFYFDFESDLEFLLKMLTDMFNDISCGNVIRVKGIVKTPENRMYEINSTRYGNATKMVNAEKSVLIAIGEDLHADSMEKYLGKPTV